MRTVICDFKMRDLDKRLVYRSNTGEAEMNSAGQDW